MPLKVNSRLGPYEIKSPLGAGGMGEVYRARDSRLNRDVAVKVLRTDVTGGAELRSRFEREARAVAALNHPNIVVVYDFGIEADQQYIVSELIDGESLRSLLRGKAVAARKLVDIASQAADGLAAAHAAGIVHRDLKPENIMIAKDGRVKILDFGLARQARPSGILAAGNQDETIALVPEDRNITGEGAVIGTPSYMSPEQALGRELDYRSDQFSFGLILYELASGKQAFAKSSTIETMAAIVREEPALVDEKLPPPLRWIIDRCLAKEPEQRYQSTVDLFRDLKNLRDHFSEAHISGLMTPIVAPSTRSWWRVTAIGVACLLIGTTFTYLVQPRGQDISKYRYMPLATDADDAQWSPDGKSIAYQAKSNGVYQIFLRNLNAPAATQLTHESTDTYLLGWSADSSHLVVRTKDPDLYEKDRSFKFWTVAIFGGELQEAWAGQCRDCRLSSDGKVFMDVRSGNEKDKDLRLWITDPLGTAARPYLPVPFACDQTYGKPSLALSPNGTKLFVAIDCNVDYPEVWVLSYPPGNETPRKIQKDFHGSTVLGSSWFPDNRHVALSLVYRGSLQFNLWILDTDSGDMLPLTEGSSDKLGVGVSPDGTSIIYNDRTEFGDLASISIKEGSVSVLATGAHSEISPAWASRQTKLTWISWRNGSSEIWLRNSDGSERPVVTVSDFPTNSTRYFMNPVLAPGDDRLIYGRSDAAGRIQLWISLLNGSPPVRVTNSTDPGAEDAGDWSPDGRQYAYLHDNGNTTDLKIVRTSGNATPIVLKPDVNSLFMPAWSPVGDWITFKDKTGASLISPDGKRRKVLGTVSGDNLAFSKDGTKLYGVMPRSGASNNHPALIEIDISTSKSKTIRELGDEWEPSGDLVRFSLSPDGTSLLSSVYRSENDIWMLQGFRQPSWLDRFSLH